MHFAISIRIAVAASFAAGLVHAGKVGDAIVQNNCHNKVYLWSVGGSVGERQTLEPGDQYVEKLHYDDTSGGISIKITRTKNGLYDGSPQLNFQYALTDHLYYALSAVFGNPFSSDTLLVHPSVDTCNNICWVERDWTKAREQTETCSTNADITLVLCAESC